MGGPVGHTRLEGSGLLDHNRDTAESTGSDLSGTDGRGR